MRLLHFSDLHIGIENYGRPLTQEDLPGLPDYFAPGESRQRYLGYSTRLVDFLCAFDELVAYALTNDVDLVLFSGDAYKSREPTQTHQREFAKRISRLASHGVPTFLLVGNHDLPHASYKATAVEIFETLHVPHVTVAERLDVYQVQTRKGPLQVLALPWVRRSVFLAQDEVRNLPYDQINKMLEEKLTYLLRDLAEGLDSAIPSVMAAHVSLNTAKLGSERTMMVGYDHLLLKSDVINLPVDYIALGHIHRSQKLSESPPMAYAGSLQRVDFGEEDDEAKGFYIIDIDPGKPAGGRVTSVDFRPVDARAFVTVDVTVPEGDPDPTETVLRAIGRHHVAGAIVRVHVRIPAELEAALRERDVRSALMGDGLALPQHAHTVAGVTRLVERAHRTRIGAGHASSKSPSELLRLYMETKEIGEERAAKLSAYAERLMREEGEAGQVPDIV